MSYLCLLFYYLKEDMKVLINFEVIFPLCVVNFLSKKYKIYYNITHFNKIKILN